MHTATLGLMVALIAIVVCINAQPNRDIFWRPGNDNDEDKRGNHKLKYNQFHHIGIGKRADKSATSPERNAELQKFLLPYVLQVLDSEMSRLSNSPDQQENKGLFAEDK